MRHKEVVESKDEAGGFPEVREVEQQSYESQAVSGGGRLRGGRLKSRADRETTIVELKLIYELRKHT